ncbi:AbrB/MazE/SpoVT family DNA-binding domain-containing protein [Aeoliella sp. ICT_H6.2]|uniref:AbrB/MazE/SpoVT family DNA-binding domain-containing protein n=1 Tax=Aeoliella straminimaris TaxID=2954799 RepID=A0A9X2F914_9BACT|nr:AbrB/MazE/SpoVT family DNA-binding domain-containing protein [Aeoliella straminimaris]MCO6044550.1 AbrB/MazE/SpoVT family DNA-binding domain-containing protein [Aeoliella straminimaris]
MEINLIPIGNSQGVRLPKSVIEQAGLAGPLELEVADGAVIIRPAKKNPREGWEEEAAELHALGGDNVDDWDCTLLDFDGEWEW